MNTIDELEKLKTELPKIAEQNIQKRMEVYEETTEHFIDLKRDEGIECKKHLESKLNREKKYRRQLIRFMSDGNAYNKADILAKIECEDEYDKEILHEAEYKYLRAYAGGTKERLSQIMMNNSILKLELK